jgi:hypothetical protein
LKRKPWRTSLKDSINRELPSEILSFFKPAKDGEGFLPALPTNQFFCPEIDAYFWSLLIDTTAVIFPEVDTLYPGRLAIRHAGNGRRDGWGDAAGPAILTAIHDRYRLVSEFGNSM